jgi:predicted phage terminase large subunit-like protein
VIQSWDLRFSKSQAASSSYVVGTVWAKFGANAYLVDCVRGKWSYTESRDQIQELSARWPMAFAKLIENKANGPAIEDDLRDDIPGIILFDPRGDKIQRLERVAPLFRAGNVHLPAGVGWMREFESELLAFPNAENDDQVDSTSMALGWIYEGNSEVDDILWV